MLPEACGLIEEFSFCREQSACDVICPGSSCVSIEPAHFYNLLLLARRYGSVHMSNAPVEWEYGAACPLHLQPNGSIDLVKGHSAKIIHKYYTIPDCGNLCAFGCSPAAIDDWEFSQLTHNGIGALQLFSCDSFPNWLQFTASVFLIGIFFGIFVFIVFYICSPRKTANIHVEPSKDDQQPAHMGIPMVVIESPRESFADDNIFS